jgi:hypothetical protein
MTRNRHKQTQRPEYASYDVLVRRCGTYFRNAGDVMSPGVIATLRRVIPTGSQLRSEQLPLAPTSRFLSVYRADHERQQRVELVHSGCPGRWPLFAQSGPVTVLPRQLNLRLEQCSRARKPQKV